ncbi:MAG: transporter suffix domain-containing protein [Magnetococcus sp. DMHC-6]
MSAGSATRVLILAMRKTSGYFLLIYSCLVYGMIAALPFFEISVGEAAAFITGLIISGEAAFLLGIALLGKEALAKIKAVFRKK